MIKIGDVVYNGWVSPNRPGALLVVVGVFPKSIHCINPLYHPHHISKFARDSRLRLEVVGKFDLSPFKKVVDDFIVKQEILIASQ